MTVGYIATADFQAESVGWVGEASTPKAAFNDLKNSGEFNDYCATKNIGDGVSVEVGVFKAIFEGDDGWLEDFSEMDWRWVLGERVDTKFVTYFE